MLTILDAQDSPTYACQAVADKVDFAALAALGQQTGVVSGCTVTPHSAAYSVDVAAGVIIYQGTEQAVSSVSALAPGAASTSDRRDIVQVSSTGTVSIKAGTPCGYTAGAWFDGCGFNAPVKPMPDSGKILLAEITIPGSYTSTTSISSGMIVDKTAAFVTATSTAQGEADTRGLNSTAQLATPASAVPGGSQRYAALGAGLYKDDAAQLQQTNAWVQDQNSPTFVSATTFTVSGNLTSTYQKGMAYKWTESSVQKYGVIASSSYSSGTGLTTVTFIITTDYSMAATPDANSAYYSIGRPLDFPTRFLFAPTPTGFSVNPNTPVCWWSVANGMLTFQVGWVNPGTSNAGTFTVPMPMPASAGISAVGGIAQVEDSGTWSIGAMVISASSSTLTFNKVAGTANGFTASGSKNVTANGCYPI
jgi:hypothetical protein